MMFSEFQENTGCKDNDYNYKLYKRLEIIYMNDDTISKSEIYEMGKKLMDNSKSESELALEAELKAEIAEYKEQIESYKRCIENEKTYFTPNKAYIKHCKDEIAYYKKRIAGCKFVLGGV